MVNISSEDVIGKCLETAFELKTYVKIMEKVRDSKFKADANFRKQFNGFYKVQRMTGEWYEEYYKLLEEQISNPKDFGTILKILYSEDLYTKKPRVEVSYTSKLIATANSDKPIWDQFVLKNLGYETEWHKYNNKSFETRVNKAVEIYGKIETDYLEFMGTKEGKECIHRFNELLPKYASITDVKKIDFYLWSLR